jgi:hypothetical protein
MIIISYDTENFEVLILISSMLIVIKLIRGPMVVYSVRYIDLNQGCAREWTKNVHVVN